MAIAIIELGMSSETFWQLSFYEWSIWILRIRNIQIQRDQERIFWGNWMMFYGNSMIREGAEQFKREDFYTISTDEKKVQEEKLSPEVLQSKMENVLKRG